MSGSKRNRRVAERLNLQLDAGERLLASLSSVASSLAEEQGHPWSSPSFKKVSAAFLKKFPEYPSLSDVEKSQGPEELQLKSRETCEALEEKYLALHDAVEIRIEIWKLLNELAGDTNAGDCSSCMTVAFGFLDLLRIYIQMSLLIAQIPNKKLLACYYAYCYQYATGFADTNFSRTAKLLHEQCDTLDKCFGVLRRDAAEIPTGVSATRKVSVAHFTQQLLLGTGDHGSNSILALYQCFATEALIDDDLLGLLSMSESVQYPAGMGGGTKDELLYFHIPKIGSMKVWLVMGYLLCPECIYLHPHGLEGLRVVCAAGTIIDCRTVTIWTHVELYKIFHDKTFISGYEAALEKKGFKDGKAAFKEAVQQFTATSASEHMRRREYLARRITQIYHTLSDCPGLFGPQWGLVVSALALAREEIMWYFQHLIPLPKEERVYTKLKLDLGVGFPDLASLFASCLQLRNCAVKYLDTVSQYHSTYIRDVLNGRIEETCRSCEGLDQQVPEFIQAATQTVKESSEGDSLIFPGFRLDIERAQILMLRRCGPNGSSTSLTANQTKLMASLTKSWHVSLPACRPMDSLFQAAGFQQLWWYAAEFQGFMREAMSTSPANALVMLQITDDFPRAGHIKLPRQLQEVGAKAMDLAEDSLRSIAARAVQLIRQQTQESNMILAELCRQAVLEMATVRVFTREYCPGEYLIEAIMADLTSFIKSNLWIKDCMTPPSVVEQRVKSHVATLRVVEVYAGVPMQEIVEPVFAALFVDTDGGLIGSALKLPEKAQRSGREATAIGKWFLAEILKPKVYTVPFQQRFEGKHSQLDQLTSPSELQALCRLIGPYGVRGIEKVMLKRCADNAQRVMSCLTNNSYLLRSLSAEDKNQMDASKIMKLTEISQLHDMAKALLELGTILEFRKLLLSALGEVMEPTKIPESLRIALSSTNGRLRSKDTSALDTLAHDCGAAGRLWPVDPALRTALTADGGPLSPANVNQGSWTHAVYALSAFVLSNSMAPLEARYNPTRQAFRNNIHCAPSAILALVVLSQAPSPSGKGPSNAEEDPTVLAERKIQGVITDLVSCTARLVVEVLHQREEKGKTKKDQDHIELLYLEHLLSAAEAWNGNSTVRRVGLPEALARSVHLWQLKSRNTTSLDTFDDDDD